MESTKKILGPNSFEGFSEWLQLTWGQMLEFCHMLDDDQLAQPVRVWGEEFGMTIVECSQTSLSIIGKRVNPGNNSVTYLILRNFIMEMDIKYHNWPITALYKRYEGTDGEPIRLYYVEELTEDFLDDGDSGVISQSEYDEYPEEEQYDADVVYPAGTIFINNGIG